MKNSKIQGSKIFALRAFGDKKRELATMISNEILQLKSFTHAFLAMPGVLVLEGNKFISHEKTEEEISELHPSTRSADIFTEMRNLTDEDLVAIAGHILLQPKILGSQWGGGNSYNSLR